MEILYAKPCRIFMAHSWMSKRPDNAHVWLLSPYSSCFCGFDIYHSRLNVVLKLPPPPLPPSPRPTRLIPRPTPLFPRFIRLARETAGVSFCKRAAMSAHTTRHYHSSLQIRDRPYSANKQRYHEPGQRFGAPACQTPLFGPLCRCLKQCMSLLLLGVHQAQGAFVC